MVFFRKASDQRQQGAATQYEEDGSFHVEGCVIAVCVPEAMMLGYRMFEKDFGSRLRIVVPITEAEGGVASKISRTGSILKSYKAFLFHSRYSVDLSFFLLLVFAIG